MERSDVLLMLVDRSEGHSYEARIEKGLLCAPQLSAPISHRTMLAMCSSPLLSTSRCPALHFHRPLYEAITEDHRKVRETRLYRSGGSTMRAQGACLASCRSTLSSAPLPHRRGHSAVPHAGCHPLPGQGGPRATRPAGGLDPALPQVGRPYRAKKETDPHLT